MIRRDTLLKKGFFPETLPPCFDSTDLRRGFKGIVADLKARAFHKNRSASYIRYSGTKHDGSRRPYATVNPVSYFNLSNFIEQNAATLDDQFAHSQFSISTPHTPSAKDDRALIVTSLSQLSARISKQIKFSPYLLKADIAQYFPSIYTHVLPWIAHGRTASKIDRNRNSTTNTFNQLDWFCQQCQAGQTRGLVIGPDGFRIVAEYIACEIDIQLQQRVSRHIIGGIRHVDDFYIGVWSEVDATLVLSQLRDILQNFELQVNDAKTRILSGLEPIDDTWAQSLREMKLGTVIGSNFSFGFGDEFASRLLDEAFETAKRIHSESPMKLALRRLDQSSFYRVDEVWTKIEPKLQRILYHFPHCVDYICLLLIKRAAIDREIDSDGWSSAMVLLLKRHIAFSHHHEVCWLVWSMLSCRFHIEESLVKEVLHVKNSHVYALVIGAYADGLLKSRPAIDLSFKLSSTDDDWLHHLAARSTGYSKASFDAGLRDEFEHLAVKHVKLIDFNKHLKNVAKEEVQAISRSKYGYDDTGFDDDDDEF